MATTWVTGTLSLVPANAYIARTALPNADLDQQILSGSSPHVVQQSATTLALHATYSLDDRLMGDYSTLFWSPLLADIQYSEPEEDIVSHILETR